MSASLKQHASSPELTDDFPDTPARRAVVAVVRGYGAISRQMGPHFAGFGLSAPQFQMLTVLNQLRGQQVTQRILGNELYVSFPNVTVMLARLEKAGLVERKVNDSDRREKFVSITKQGRSLLRKIWKKQPIQLEQVMSGLGEQERLDLTRLLNKMIAADALSDGD
jgi:MarR family transcriptional regulator, 2-MHQ and catechol-resistance regulon repressor